jgi:hypothetical protein
MSEASPTPFSPGGFAEENASSMLVLCLAGEGKLQQASAKPLIIPALPEKQYFTIGH